jgi:hypothetical protein
MYQAHPSRDTLFAGIPQNLVDATQNIQPILFQDLQEMHHLVWDLAAFIVDWKPDLIPFFATGGIPYLFPVMHILEKQKQRAFIDGHHFHLFPGLAWDGTIDGQTSDAFFSARFGGIIREKVGGEKLRILVIDTTNTGNAINNAVAACQDAIRASGVSPDQFSLKVIGIVNASHAAAQKPSADKSLFTGANRSAYILTPARYSASSPLLDRQITTFSPVAANEACSFELTYWLAGNIPTEDNAELIGVEAVHETLTTTSKPRAGRPKVIYGNNETQQGTGLGSLSGRLLSLLWTPLDAWQWKKMEEINELPPLTPEEEQELAETRELSQGGLRLFELKSMDPSQAVTELMKLSRLLEDVEVYWLRTLDPTPKNVAPKVRASLEINCCTGAEAVWYFRRAFPEIAEIEPGGDASPEWWIEQLRLLSREAFSNEPQSSKLVMLEHANSEDEPNNLSVLDDLALDFVVIAGGVDEAQRLLSDVKAMNLSLLEIEKYLERTWPVTVSEASTFHGPTMVDPIV